MEDSLEILSQRMMALVLNCKAHHIFWAGYTEDRRRVATLLEQHPTLIVYSICSWGTETWLFRGERSVNVLGYLLGAGDLGSGFSQQIPNSEL